MKNSFFILFLIFCFGCESSTPNPILLDQLTNLEIEKAGNILIDREFGFHKIINNTVQDSSFGLVFVHGYGSLGKEWVNPISDLSCKSVPMYWYRWDWNQCPERGRDELLDSLSILADQMNYDSLLVIGHSYGGLIAALASELWQRKTKLIVHSIAAPLTGIPKSKSLCNFDKQRYEPSKNSNLIQWKTVHSQDNAFNKYEKNPQIVDIINGSVYQLDGEWNGIRLGHNRSISYFSNQLCME